MKSAPNGSTPATTAVPNKMLERVASTSHPEDMPDSTKLTSRAATPSNNMPKLPMGMKDSKGRAKSREFLQQCLQEIAYLTSNATLNPIIHTTDPTDPDSASQPPRPQFVVSPQSAPAQEVAPVSNHIAGPNAEANTPAAAKEADSSAKLSVPSQPPFDSPEDVMPVSSSRGNPAVQQPDKVPDVQLWHPHGSFSSHLDAVRALVYDGSGEGLFTASDDCTIKYWRMLPTAAQTGQSKPVAELLTTLRGHEAAVTCLAYSKTHNILYSGSLDASIRQWNIPSNTPSKSETVSLCLSTVLPGSEQAVWGLSLFPYNGQEDMLLVSVSASGKIQLWNTSEKEPQPLLSWDYFGTDPAHEVQEERKSLSSIPVPTYVTKCPANLQVCVVSFTNGTVKLFNLVDGKELMAFKPPFDSHAQANMVVGHPTLPLVATAHEDNYIHVYDIRANACVLSLHAHRDSVTCLDIDPSGLTFVSGSHNGTVRFWDLMKMGEADSSVPTYQAKCFQEVQAHEVQSQEGVLAVAFHPSSPLVATSGADGTVRMYG